MSISTHLLSPRAGRILVFRTHDNKYAKMEIIYFYDSPNPDTGSGDLVVFIHLIMCINQKKVIQCFN